MILESFLVLGVVGIILVFFYRQAVQEFRILQTDSLEKAMPLLYERCPIVVLPIQQPHQLWTRSDINQRPSLKAHLVNGISLGIALEQESFPLQSDLAESIATQVGLPVWVKQTLLPLYQQSIWWSPILTSRTEVAIGAQGLRQTYAYSTILLATEGTLSVSLVNESADAYLPPKWLGKRVSKLTKDEAPLLHQIQYIDVLIRPGSALIIPPHWKVCWETYKENKPALSVWIEVHHPLSHFVRAASFRKLR
jgi:hypothetical protein